MSVLQLNVNKVLQFLASTHKVYLQNPLSKPIFNQNQVSDKIKLRLNAKEFTIEQI